MTTTANTMTDAIAMSSPNGRMSKRARDAANKQLHDKLFPPGYWDAPELTAAEKLERRIECNRRAARDLRDLASRGMHVKKYPKEADRLESEADTFQAVLNDRASAEADRNQWRKIAYALKAEPRSTALDCERCAGKGINSWDGFDYPCDCSIEGTQ